MTTKREFIIEAGDRNGLCNGISMNLIANRMQIRGGMYEVSIRKLSRKEITKMEEEEKRQRENME